MGLTSANLLEGLLMLFISFQFNYDNNIYHCRDNERLMHQRIILHLDQFFIFSAKTFFLSLLLKNVQS